MNGRNPPKSREGDSALDKLSNLPSHIIDHILIYLPLRDAVRTSVLSSKWRFKWTTMPALVFDKRCISFTPQDQTIINKNKLVTLIDYTLLLHSGPISKFMLYQRNPIGSIDIDRWILYLSRCNVQEFILEIWEGESYQLHSCLYSFQNLVHLELYRCHLKFPSDFGGFKKLKSLYLQDLTMVQDVFETLISSCPILESLTFLDVDGFTHLNIDAPNLLDIAFRGYFDDINFINTSNLATVSVELAISEYATERTKPRDSSNLLKFLSSLPCIRRLVIENDFIEYLATGDMPGQLSNLCPDLVYLKVGGIFIDDYGESSTALWLLRSCPNIQELEMTVYLSQVGEEFTFWESVDKNRSLNKLRTVNINGISGNKHELEFVRLMLVASPVLQKMTIKPSSENQALMLSREQLLSFERASAEAEVVFLS